MTTLEITWAILGQPLDPSQTEWPVTVHDLNSKRLRYQMVHRYIGLALSECGGMAKMTARWCQDRGRHGEWQLLDLLPDNVTVLPESEAA